MSDFSATTTAYLAISTAVEANALAGLAPSEKGLTLAARSDSANPDLAASRARRDPATWRSAAFRYDPRTNGLSPGCWASMGRGTGSIFLATGVRKAGKPGSMVRL